VSRCPFLGAVAEENFQVPKSPFRGAGVEDLASKKKNLKPKKQKLNSKFRSSLLPLTFSGGYLQSFIIHYKCNFTCAITKALNYLPLPTKPIYKANFK
jgi:hypothetical protein